jgi:hypothetical protein
VFISRGLPIDPDRKKFLPAVNLIRKCASGLDGKFSFTLRVEISVNTMVNDALVEHKQGLWK